MREKRRERRQRAATHCVEPGKAKKAWLIYIFTTCATRSYLVETTDV